MSQAPRLASESRSRLRAEFDLKMKKKMEAIEAEKQRLRDLLEEQEDQEVNELRDQTYFKANPIKKYRNVEGSL